MSVGVSVGKLAAKQARETQSAARLGDSQFMELPMF